MRTEDVKQHDLEKHGTAYYVEEGRIVPREDLCARNLFNIKRFAVQPKES